jgi:hypothetical protein
VQPPPGPGVFEPVAPTPPVDVVLTQVRPLTFRSPSRFRPDGPTRLGSHAYARDLAEVQALGRADSAVRTPAQPEVARFWSENTFAQWGRDLRGLATAERLGVRDTARLLAMAHTASADAVIGCFDAKYHYLSWRPVHGEARLARIAGGLRYRHSMLDGERLGRRIARHVTRHHFRPTSAARPGPARP